jgi:isopenicillin N synthase-like dioxygenase
MFLLNHGISNHLIQSTFEQIRAFFALPLHVKLQIKQDENNRGYSPLYEQNLNPAEQKYRGDTCEGMYFGREIALDDPEASLPLHGPNQWPQPELLPEFRQTIEAYYAANRKLGMRVIRLIALALDLPSDYFDAYFEKPTMLLRPLHYVSKPSDPEQGTCKKLNLLHHMTTLLIIGRNFRGRRTYRLWHGYTPNDGR